MFRHERFGPYDGSSTISTSTSLSAKSRKLQRAWPSGGREQAKATRRASCSPSSLRWYSLFGGRLFSAASRPSQQYCLRTLERVGWLDSSASAILSSTHPSPFGPSSALSRMRAWVSLRAGAVPEAIRLFRSSRSVWLRITGYFFFIMGGAYPLCPSLIRSSVTAY